MSVELQQGFFFSVFCFSLFWWVWPSSKANPKNTGISGRTLVSDGAEAFHAFQQVSSEGNFQYL